MFVLMRNACRCTLSRSWLLARARDSHTQSVAGDEPLTVRPAPSSEKSSSTAPAPPMISAAAIRREQAIESLEKVSVVSKALERGWTVEAEQREHGERRVPEETSKCRRNGFGAVPLSIAITSEFDSIALRHTDTKWISAQAQATCLRLHSQSGNKEEEKRKGCNDHSRWG